jgi:hypothetical protein
LLRACFASHSSKVRLGFAANPTRAQQALRCHNSI